MKKIMNTATQQIKASALNLLKQAKKCETDPYSKVTKIEINKAVVANFWGWRTSGE